MHAATHDRNERAELKETEMPALPTIFLSHGAPTWAIEPGIIAPRLAALAGRLPRPRAILVVSPHWTSPELRVMTSPVPKTVHDFGGFPRALYQLQYPAPGHVALRAASLTASFPWMRSYSAMRIPPAPSPARCKTIPLLHEIQDGKFRY